MTERLRPLERRVLAMKAEGLSNADIAARLKRSPEHVGRIIEWTDLPRTSPSMRAPRALERRVLDLRDEGVSYEEIGRRFRRGPGFIRQVEGLAHLRTGVAMLERSSAHRRSSG